MEAYRAKVNAERQQQRQQQQQQQQQQPQHLNVENDNGYRRADSDYSIDNLSQLFNAGDDAAPRYLLADQPPVHRGVYTPPSDSLGSIPVLSRPSKLIHTNKYRASVLDV